MTLCSCCDVHPDYCKNREGAPQEIAAPTARFKMTRVAPVSVDIEVEEEGSSSVIHAMEFQPTKGKRYIFSIEVGQVGAMDVHRMLSRFHKQIANFMDGIPYMVTPMRGGHPVIGIYELEKES